MSSQLPAAPNELEQLVDKWRMAAINKSAAHERHELAAQHLQMDVIPDENLLAELFATRTIMGHELTRRFDLLRYLASFNETTTESRKRLVAAYAWAVFNNDVSNFETVTITVQRKAQKVEAAWLAHSPHVLAVPNTIKSVIPDDAMSYLIVSNDETGFDVSCKEFTGLNYQSFQSNLGRNVLVFEFDHMRAITNITEFTDGLPLPFVSLQNSDPNLGYFTDPSELQKLNITDPFLVGRNVVATYLQANPYHPIRQLASIAGVSV